MPPGIGYGPDAMKKLMATRRTNMGRQVPVMPQRGGIGSTIAEMLQSRRMQPGQPGAAPGGPMAGSGAGHPQMLQALLGQMGGQAGAQPGMTPPPMGAPGMTRAPGMAPGAAPGVGQISPQLLQMLLARRANQQRMNSAMGGMGAAGGLAAPAMT